MRMVLVFSAFCFVLLAGCAPKVQKDKGLVFFPPAPDPPRIQFLLGIGDSRDVEGDEVEFSLVSLNASSVQQVKTFIKPYGVVADGSKLYVSDTLAGKVAVIDLKLKSFEWLKGDFGPGDLKKPINMAVDSDGQLYVADTVKKKVVVFDSEGNFVRTYAETQDVTPIDVAVDKNKVYVLDKSRSKLLILSKKSGKLLETLGQHNDNVEDNLSLPTNMALNDEGVFYIANVGSGKIIQMDRDGHVLNALGTMGDGFGQFGRPKGVAIDSERRLYSVDAAHQNVQMFNDAGRLLMFFGSPGLPEGSLNLPAGIDVTSNDLDFYQQLAAPGFNLEQVVVVVNQVGQHRVNIYGLGKQQNIDYDEYYRATAEIHRKNAEREAKKLEEEKKAKEASKKKK